MKPAGFQRFLAIAAIVFSLGGIAAAAEGESLDSPALVKWKELFQEASKKAREKLLASFDTALEQIPEAKWSADEKDRVTKAVIAEKLRFVSHGLAPWSAPMRLPYAAYRKQMDINEAAIRRAFDVDIKKATREKAVERVAELKNELAALIPDQPIAYWNHLAENNPPVIIAMFADGSFTDRGAHRVCQWVVAKDKLLLKWPSGTPGQFLLDSCDLALDGSLYEGKNHANDRISGNYHPVTP